MKKLFVLIAAACMTCTAAFAQTVKPFKEGERAVFLGNSITDGGHYHLRGEKRSVSICGRSENE